MELSEYIKIVLTVPETHAHVVREALGNAGAGKIGNYSHCSFSVKGIGRFKPLQGSNPFLGKQEVLEEVIEERIETICHRTDVAHILAEVKKAHPYEEPVIDLYPIYLTDLL